MQELKVIENELVPVYETSTGEKVVYGSELHEVLGAPSVYREWIKRRLSDIDATENEEYQGVEISTPSGQTKKDHIIKLDTAKEMAMLERNEKGKQVRKYFIQVEKKNKEKSADLSDLSVELQAIIMHDKKIQRIETRMEKRENDTPLYGSEAAALCSHVKRKGVEVMGSKKSYASQDTKIRTAVYTDIYNQIKREFGLYDDRGRYTSYKSLKRKYIKEAHGLIDSYEPPTCLRERIADCNAQISLGGEVAG